TKMHSQPARWSEMHQEMLAVPQGLGDPRTFEALSQLAGRDACEDPRIANDNAADALAEAGRIQMPLEQFDIGQFRHRILRRCPRARFLPQRRCFYRWRTRG